MSSLVYVSISRCTSNVSGLPSADVISIVSGVHEELLPLLTDIVSFSISSQRSIPVCPYLRLVLGLLDWCTALTFRPQCWH